MDFSVLHEAGVDWQRGFTVCGASSFWRLPATILHPVLVTDIGDAETMDSLRRLLLSRYDGASPAQLWRRDGREKTDTVIGALSFSETDGPCALFFDPEACLRRSADSFSIDRLLAVMEALRAPGGCPWDRAQTHETLRTYLIQEAYEVADAIDRGDRDNLKEELGDVLYQVVFHARAAEEEGAFTMQDVVNGICDKMVERHPYVFGTLTEAETAELLGTWEIRKMRKKRREHLLAGLSPCLPSLLFACIMQKKVSSICREKAENAEDRRDRFESSWRKAMEMAETGSAPETVERCFGKALFEMVALLRDFDVEPELALHRFNSLYAEQFGEWETELREKGRSATEAEPEDFQRLRERLKDSDLC